MFFLTMVFSWLLIIINIWFPLFVVAFVFVYLFICFLPQSTSLYSVFFPLFFTRDMSARCRLCKTLSEAFVIDHVQRQMLRFTCVCSLHLHLLRWGLQRNNLVTCFYSVASICEISLRRSFGEGGNTIPLKLTVWKAASEP